MFFTGFIFVGVVIVLVPKEQMLQYKEKLIILGEICESKYEDY